MKFVALSLVRIIVGFGLGEQLEPAAKGLLHPEDSGRIPEPAQHRQAMPGEALELFARRADGSEVAPV